MGYQVSSLDELGEGPGFRKIRPALGVTAFGANAVVYPPHYVGPAHYHDSQDELYFVHRGRAVFTIDGTAHEVGEGGLVHVESTTPRQITNAGDEVLVLVVVGGKGGYVERDGHLVDPEVDLPRRQGLSPKGRAMNGLMMDYQLTLPTLLRRAESYFGGNEIVTRLPDRSFARSTYADVCRRSRALAVALRQLGLERGDRVATLCWNHQVHHEAYLGIPCGGFVLHTLNLRLHPNDLAYIATHAGDRAVIVDRQLLPLLQQFVDRTPIEHVLVVEDSYEELLAGVDPDDWRDPELDENEAAAMCYTSGTTGQPKGVLYSHRSTMLHTLGVAAGNPLGKGVGEQDTILPVVPMFHANAWGYPYVATMAGAKLVYPGPHLDAESLLEDFVAEGVTWTAGVPTIWLGILHKLDAEPGRWDLSRMKGMLVGGSAAPRALIAGFKERHGLDVVHGWGMTETSPVATTSQLPGALAHATPDEQFDAIALQGLPLPLVELRHRDELGQTLPWDGEAMGELEVRGPWVAAAYYETPEQADRWTDDGWFRTGDVVTITPLGFVQIKDRSKDVIKSGGEWISSVELENALMAHPAVLEAAVVAVPDEKWDERPLAAVVLQPGATATADELRAFLAPDFAKWWLPDRFEFVDEIPKTSVGKFRKTALRDQFAGERAGASS